jgi:hypothetical protein
MAEPGPVAFWDDKEKAFMGSGLGRLLDCIGALGVAGSAFSRHP